MKDSRTRMGRTIKSLAMAVVAILLLAAIAAPVAAQGRIDSEGTSPGPREIKGTVLDIVDGSPPSSDVTISIIDATDGSVDDTFTANVDGTYSRAVSADGLYNITFEAVDYEAFTVNERTLSAGVTYHLNVSLAPLPSTVSGTVTDALTGEAIEGVTVSLHETTFDTDQTVYTDENGQYNISTTTRAYTMIFQDPAYVGFWDGIPVALDINSSVVRDMALERNMVSLSGQVSGSGPVVGADVALMGLVDYSTDTNDTGWYSFTPYWGDYTLAVDGAGFYHYTKAVSLGPSAMMVEHIDLVKTPPQNAEAFGYVKDAANKMPVEGATVCFMDQDNGGRLCMETGADGYFYFSIYPAYFQLQVKKDGFITHKSFVSISKDESKNVGDILLETTPPMDKKVSGTVSSGGMPVMDASVTLLDSGVAVVSATSDAGGNYSMMTYAGTFDVEVEAAGYFSLKQTGLAIDADVIKDFSLVAVPALDNDVIGYVKDPDGRPIKDATVTLVDRDPAHGGHVMTTMTSAGGYYSFQVYAGDFIWMVDAVGFDAELDEVTVDGDESLDIVLWESAQQPMTTNVAFEVWDNLTIETSLVRSNDVKVLRYTIDNVFGDGNLNVSQAEVDAWLAVEKDKGPEDKDTKDMFKVDGIVYSLLDGTFEVSAEGATGDIFASEPVTITRTGDYQSKKLIKDEEEHFIVYNVTFDNAVMDRAFEVTVPAGWEARNITSEEVDVSGTFTVTMDPPMEDAGVDYELVTLNVTGNSPPVADAGKNRTIKVNVNETFYAKASKDDFGIANYTWDFDDGEMGYGSEAVHMFSLDGKDKDWWNYTVSLTVRDTAGVTNTTTIWVVVDGAPPTVSFVSNKTAANEDGDDIEFNASATKDNVGVANYTWDFDDGRFGYGMAVTHNWTQPGTYNVTLNVTDKAGWWANHTVSVTVKDITHPIAKMDYKGSSPYYIDQEEHIAIVNGSRSTDNVEVVKWKWDFGDGTIVERTDGDDINHTYTTTGEYNITLTVLDAAGNTNTSEPYELEVMEKPKIPDIVLESIKVEPEGFRDGDEVTITIKVLNNGDGGIVAGQPNSEFSVQFSYGKHKIDVKKHLTIDAHSSKTIKQKWKAKEGTYKICADADPENRIGETSDQNNKKCTDKLEVGMSWSGIGMIGGLVLVLVLLVVIALWRSRVAKRERKERLRQRKKR